MNQVLAEYDSIGIGEEIAADEYMGYISLIIKSSEKKTRINPLFIKFFNS